MKKRKSSAHLIISSCHLGMSKNVLKTLQQVQQYYQATVYHLGTIVTAEEKKMYERRINRIRTWENMTDLSDKELERFATWESEVNQLIGIQDKRVDTLINTFGEMVFVLNEEQCLEYDEEFKGQSEYEYQLGKHLILSSVSANGERLATNPITPKSFNYFKTRGSSFIVPHPTGCLRSFNKEGLNNAYVIATTGSLHEKVKANRPSEHYIVNNRPGAVLVIVDEESGEFHLKRLRFATHKKITQHLILDDGIAFTPNEVIVLDGKDKGLFTTDDHAPYEHRGVLSSLLALGELHEPETLINGGDAADMESVCRHNDGKPLLQENKRIINDIYSLANLLSIQGSIKSVKKRILLDSNHAEWLTDYVARHPQLFGILDWKTINQDYFPEWEVYLRDQQRICKFGDLALRHGDKDAGLAGLVKTFYKAICGHYHTHNEMLEAATTGPGCRLGPKYLQGSLTSWTNTLTTLSKYKEISGYNIKTILHNDEAGIARFAYRGNIYEVEYV